MPWYDMTCSKCGKHEEDVVIKLEDFDEGHLCECGNKMDVVIMPVETAFKGQWHNYKHEGYGRAEMRYVDDDGQGWLTKDGHTKIRLKDSEVPSHLKEKD